MSRKDPTTATEKPKKLSVKRQTVSDLPATKAGAEKVRGGGGSRQVAQGGDIRNVVAVC